MSPSPSTGLGTFTSPIYRTEPVFNGVSLAGIPVPLEKRPTRPANLLVHGDGSVTVQLDYTGIDQPETAEHYQFSFPLQAREEEIWWTLERARKRGVGVYLVPWDQEEEVFTVGLSGTAFVLPRPTAKSVLPLHADIAEYPSRAWLNSVSDANEQDIVETGTPGAGEVKIVGRDITTPALAAGTVLIVRYCPAYLVVVTELPQRMEQARVLSRQVTLTEVREGL